MWVQTQPNSQSSFQKLNVDNSCQKTRKIRYYIFEVLSNFTVFLQFVPNILARIVDTCTPKNIYIHAFQAVITSSTCPTKIDCNLRLHEEFEFYPGKRDSFQFGICCGLFTFFKVFLCKYVLNYFLFPLRRSEISSQ